VRRPADGLPPALRLLVGWERPGRFDHHVRRLDDGHVDLDIDLGRRLHQPAHRRLATRLASGRPRDDERTGSPGNVLDDHHGVRDHLLVRC
jgi:hypothetical protein